MTDHALAMIDQQPQIELGPIQVGGRKRGEALAQRGRATLTASMPSDLPRARELLRVSAIRLVGMRSTRSPRSIKNRSTDPDTCRQSSSAQTRSSPSSRAHDNSPPNPARPTWTVRSPTNSPVAAPTPAIVCERLWVSAPSTIMALVLLSDRGSTAGGHGLLGALPRSLSVRGARVNCWAVATGVGGASARVVIRVVCARAPSLISAAVLPCGRTGDMMVDRNIGPA